MILAAKSLPLPKILRTCDDDLLGVVVVLAKSESWEPRSDREDLGEEPVAEGFEDGADLVLAVTSRSSLSAGTVLGHRLRESRTAAVGCGDRPGTTVPAASMVEPSRRSGADPIDVESTLTLSATDWG